LIDQDNVMRNSYTARLSAKFQIAIPKALSDAKGWKSGQEFAFIPKGNGVLLIPVPSQYQLAGLLRGAFRNDVRDRKD